MVEVSGQNRRMSLCVFSAEHGEVIPALLPSLATQMLLAGEVSHLGMVRLPDWLPRERLLKELSKRGLRLAEKTDGLWSESDD